MISFDAVLCDFDGVLRHHDAAYQADIEQRHGLAKGALLAAAFAPERLTPAVLGQVSAKDWFESIADGLGGDERARQVVEEFREVPFWVDEEVRALLAQAQQHVPVVLVTNAMSNLDDHLDQLGLTHFADDVVSSARVGVAKPDRRIYEIAAERAGASPERCLFVDDSPENVEAARAFGMTAVHFTQAADLAAALGG